MKSADNGIFVDHRGMVAEGSNMNVAFVTPDRVFRHPSFETILSGITIQRVLQFAKRLVADGDLKEIRLADIPVSEARQAAEMMQLHQDRSGGGMGRTENRQRPTRADREKAFAPVVRRRRFGI